jgi:carotenoid cleavage dioxygenase-like enzyme
MATLTANLFRGQGERRHHLTVVEGEWPDDIDGSVFVVGPDKRQPGGHWFADHGLIEKIHLTPDSDGRILVEHRRVDTISNRLRRRLPLLFHKVAFMEVSPFGTTNFANTNVTPIDDRLFVGYDAGRPVEIDPESVAFLTPVGANDEWLQGTPGILEPLIAVAAHPAPDPDIGALWFVNYSQIKAPGEAGDTFVCRWDLEGDVHRWKVEGMSPYDSIHDIKATEHHLVFADLPFVVEPNTFKGDARTIRNQSHTRLWILRKEDLAATPPGGSVRATEVTIPMPTGHIWADRTEVDGHIRLVLQHMPLSDLMISVGRDSVDHHGRPIDRDYEGLIALSVQPSVMGRYEIDPATGAVVDSELAIDAERLWGGLLAATDSISDEAQGRLDQIWCAAVGFDPDVIPEEWWALYGDATDGVVAPADLPTEPIAGTLSRIDVGSMKVAEVFTYEEGAFPSPPTFVPRRGTTEADDGYVMVVVHRDGPKAIQVFDAMAIEQGPIATATSPLFNPNLLLHSCWMAPRSGPRRSSYRIGWRRDVLGGLRGMPGVMVRLGRMVRSVAKAEIAARR